MPPGTRLTLPRCSNALSNRRISGEQRHTVPDEQQQLTRQQWLAKLCLLKTSSKAGDGCSRNITSICGCCCCCTTCTGCCELCCWITVIQKPDAARAPEVLCCSRPCPSPAQDVAPDGHLEHAAGADAVHAQPGPDAQHQANAQQLRDREDAMWEAYRQQPERGQRTRSAMQDRIGAWRAQTMQATPARCSLPCCLC